MMRRDPSTSAAGAHTARGCRSPRAGDALRRLVFALVAVAAILLCASSPNVLDPGGIAAPAQARACASPASMDAAPCGHAAIGGHCCVGCPAHAWACPPNAFGREPAARPPTDLRAAIPNELGIPLPGTPPPLRPPVVGTSHAGRSPTDEVIQCPIPKRSPSSSRS